MEPVNFIADEPGLRANIRRHLLLLVHQLLQEAHYPARLISIELTLLAVQMGGQSTPG